MSFASNGSIVVSIVSSVFLSQFNHLCIRVLHPWLRIFPVLTFFLFSECSSGQEDPDPEEAIEEKILGTYRIEGLDDSFLKEYEAITHFDVGNDSNGDTSAAIFTPVAQQEIRVMMFSNAAYLLGVYRGTLNPSNEEFYGSVTFDNIFAISDTATLIVKTSEENKIIISLDIYASTARKRYHIQAEDIVVTRQDIIPGG